MSELFLGVEKEIHNIKLKQMGGEVEVLRGFLHYVRFQIDDTVIKYVYHLNKKDKFFLQRRAPYPLNIGTYESEEDVINIIAHDIAQIKNAKNSKKFDKFIEINKSISTILRNFEDLYLYYNISRSQTEKIETVINELQTLIFETKEQSQRVYFDKDPDSLK
ncbi:MAG: hypothetical protein ACOYVK_07775 [Bacillota bacterium]